MITPSRVAYPPPKAPPIAPSRAAPPPPKAPPIAPRVEQPVELWDPTILRIGAEIYDRQGQLIQAVQPRIDQVPFISIDYHQVLDRCNLSRRQSLRLTLSGQLHQRVLDALTTAAQGATLLVLLPRGRHQTKRAESSCGIASV